MSESRRLRVAPTTFGALVDCRDGGAVESRRPLRFDSPESRRELLRVPSVDVPPVVPPGADVPSVLLLSLGLFSRQPADDVALCTSDEA